MALPNFSIKHPRVVLGIWLLVVFAAVLPAIKLDGALSAGGFTNPRGEATASERTVERSFGDAPNRVLIAVDAKAPISQSQIESLSKTLTEFGAHTVLAPPTTRGLKSATGTTVVLVAGFKGSNTAVQNATPKLQEALSHAVDARVLVTGQPALDYQLNVHSKEDAVRAEFIVFPILLVILLLVFGSVAAAAVPLVLAGAALAVSNGLGYLATQFAEISLLYTNIVSMIGLAVAVDYSLFLIKRYREELARGREREAALSTAFKTAGRSVIFSGIAVAVALSALFIPNLMAFSSIAIGGIVVTLTALLLTMTALPAALQLLGTRINWGTMPFSPVSRRRVGRANRRRLHPAIVGGAGLVALLVVAVPVLGISLQSPIASASVLPTADTARKGLEMIERKIGHRGLFPVQIVLTARSTESAAVTRLAADKVTSKVKALDPAATVASVTTLGYAPTELDAALALPRTPEPLASLWRQDGSQIVTRVVVDPSQGPDSVATHNLVDTLRTSLVSVVPATMTVGVTGATAKGADFDQALVNCIPWIVAAVYALTFVMLAFAFRSLVLPLLALAFNSLVILASLGLLALVVRVSTTAPMNSVTPILLFAVMFGLSMDYMVIMIARIIEAHRSGLPFEDAVDSGIAKTRSMINSAAIIMVAVFAAFTSAQISIVREIGVGLAIAVLLDAVVIRMVIMPAALRTIGPRALGRDRIRYMT